MGHRPPDNQPDVVAILAAQPQTVSVVLRSPGDYPAGEVRTTVSVLSELDERGGVLPRASAAAQRSLIGPGR